MRVVGARGKRGGENGKEKARARRRLGWERSKGSRGRNEATIGQSGNESTIVEESRTASARGKLAWLGMWHRGRIEVVGSQSVRAAATNLTSRDGNVSSPPRYVQSVSKNISELRVPLPLSLSLSLSVPASSSPFHRFLSFHFFDLFEKDTRIDF